MMTRKELLAATGNVWRVLCWQNGNRRGASEVLFVRTTSEELAKQIGRRLSGRRCVDAYPYDPRSDRSVFGWIQQVS